MDQQLVAAVEAQDHDLKQATCGVEAETGLLSRAVVVEVTHDDRVLGGVDSVTFVSTVLPWVHAPSPPFVGATQAEQIKNAVSELVPWLAEQCELVWGGDWNYPLRQPLTGFTVRCRDRLASAADELGLTTYTEGELAQPTRHGRSHAIDHLASRHPKQAVQVVDGAPHSTHDAYVVELAFPRTSDGSEAPTAR